MTFTTTSELVAVGDPYPERALPLRPRYVDVDPQVVVGGLGEGSPAPG